MASIDVVVFGAGPAGCAVAAELASRGFNVAIAARRRAPRWRAAEILAPNCLPALAALGLMQRLEQDTALARPCHGVVRRWGSGLNAVSDYLAQPGGRGFIVDRGRFDALMLRRAESAGVAIHDPDHFESSARFTVDATGRSAAIARRRGIQRMRASRLVASGHEARDDAPPGWLFVEGAAEGWRYRVRACDGATHEVLVTTAAGSRIASAVDLADAPRFSCDASSMALERCAGPGWLAVGDAAASFDPIASQGLAHALTSAIAGAEAISGWLRHGDDAGLARYDTRVRNTWLHAVSGTREVYRAERRWPDAPFWAGREAYRPPPFTKSMDA